MLRSKQTPLVPTGLKFGLEAIFQLVWRNRTLNPHTRPVTYTLLAIFELVPHLLLGKKRPDERILHTLVLFLF